MVNSKRKGKVGELDLVHFFQQHNIEARRGQQFKGSDESPDVVTELKSFYVECKRGNQVPKKPYDFLDQASRDCSLDQLPVVFMRRDRCDWIVVLDASDFIGMMKDYEVSL
jgi:hypothetical protein